jgi:hypothetical protein
MSFGSGHCGLGGRDDAFAKDAVDLASHVALKAANYLCFGQTLLCPAFDVVAGGWVVTHADQDGPVKRSISLVGCPAAG